MSDNHNSITVLGGGVAGSVLAYLAKRGNLDVQLYDIVPRYAKACGEAIPAQISQFLLKNGVPEPPIVDKIRVFSIYGPLGKIVRRVVFEKPVWYIIDKGKWLDRLRASVGTRLVKEKQECGSPGLSGIVFDARGPFSSEGAKIVVWQAYVENMIGIREEALQVVDFRYSPGLVWAFSKGNEINVGGGFVGVNNPRYRSIGILEKIFNINNIDKYIIKENYSILTLIPRIKIFEKNCIRLGEAAGLIMSLGGEGIRPAILSAIAAYKSLKISNNVLSLDINEYVTRIRPLIYQARLHRLIFRIGASLGQQTIEKILGKVDEDMLEEWFSGNLGLKTRLTKLIHNIIGALL